MREAIEKRISRRKYNGEPIAADKTEKILREVARLNDESGLDIVFAEDAAAAFSSLTKTYGFFSGVRSAVVMKGRDDDPLLAEKIGYYGEELVLDLTDLGLGTCWVAGTFDRRKFDIPEGEKMLCVITVGEVGERSFRENFIRRNVSRSRKPASERLIGCDAAPDWAKNAIEAVRLAPSAVNTQRPTFRYDGGVITAFVEKATVLNLIDLGIAKKHFEIEAGGRFELGNGAKLII